MQDGNQAQSAQDQQALANGELYAALYALEQARIQIHTLQYGLSKCGKQIAMLEKKLASQQRLVRSKDALLGKRTVRWALAFSHFLHHNPIGKCLYLPYRGIKRLRAQWKRRKPGAK